MWQFENLKIEDDRLTDKPAESEVKANTKGLKPSQALLVEETEQTVRDSTYDPENNLGAPAGKTEMDSPNPTAALRIRHRAGIANYSFGVPFASLPGRGIDASIGMSYNSRVWNKTGEGTFAGYQFNVDKNWLAQGFTVGYGKLTSHFESKTVLTTSNQYKAFNEVVPEGFTDAIGFFVGALAAALLARVIGFDFLEPGYGTRVLIGLAMVGAGGGIGVQVARRLLAQRDKDAK